MNTYSLELKCENCGLVDFYDFQKGILVDYSPTVCKYCGCQTVKTTGRRKDLSAPTSLKEQIGGVMNESSNEK